PQIQKSLEMMEESDYIELKLEEEKQEVDIELAESSPARFLENKETWNILKMKIVLLKKRSGYFNTSRNSMPSLSRQATKIIFYNRPKEIL
ncbi:22504_t:CDS:1, partial [Racocetra persica]